MKNEEIYSWIFLSIALASESGPINFSEISSIADGINHTVPSQKELQESISWLLKNNLIIKEANKYKLSLNGEQHFKNASKKGKALMNIWDELANELIKF